MHKDLKILYIAPYKDGTGYSEAALGYIESLYSIDVNVVSRDCPMTEPIDTAEDFLVETESKDLQNIDVIIQHNLPSEWIYKNSVLNIGMFAYETDKISNYEWIRNIKLMDHIIVFCSDQKDALINSGIIEDNISVLPHVVKSPKTEDKITLDLPQNCTKFYSILDFNRRKNIVSMILSYYNAFSSRDNVCLILKVNSSSKDKLIKEIENIKQNSNIYKSKGKYPKIIILDNRLDSITMGKLHNYCDIYLSTSHGESWCLPATDALAHGNFVIAP